MITVHLLQNEKGYCGFLCEGHADYAVEEAQDILCSAVTSLAGTTVSSLLDILNREVEYDFQSGRLYCKLTDCEKDDDRDKIDFLFRTFALGCEQIEFSYGSHYVSVKNPQRVK